MTVGLFAYFFGLKSIRIQRRIGNDWHRDKMRKLKQVIKKFKIKNTSYNFSKRASQIHTWSRRCDLYKFVAVVSQPLGPLPRFQDAMEFLGDDLAIYLNAIHTKLLDTVLSLITHFISIYGYALAFKSSLVFSSRNLAFWLSR